jgi:hypothetical protein
MTTSSAYLLINCEHGFEEEIIKETEGIARDCRSISLNSKSITNSKVQNAEVKIKWDGKRPSIQRLLRDFRRWLIRKRIDDIEELKKQEKKHVIYTYFKLSPHKIKKNIKAN